MKSQSKEFLKLQALWYKKAKKSGFEDIEREELHLKKWSSATFMEKKNGSYFNEKKVYYDSVQEYYQMAGRFLHDYAFETPLEKTIWAYHADGISVRKIANILKKKEAKGMYYFKVQTIVKKLSTIMLSLEIEKT